MKSIKKFMAILFTVVMVFTVLTGCAGDPVAEEFEKFLNTDMAAVNTNYEELKTAVEESANLTSDEEIAHCIENSILPIINESLDMLSKIELQTEEVKAVKAKYEKVLLAYKEGYEKLLEACSTGDEATVNEAVAKIDEGVVLLDEYNAALETLAAEHGLEVQY
ncbi:MAG: hypothetical protein IKV41_04785 [Oscillospiraceae bacterium]|nr:hypothetical protein [Oscillospiraceae bacterium]